jgi:hypothetical protein
MKLDAEGSELFVLRGAENSLARLRPAIIMEVNTVLLEQGGKPAMSVAQFLIERDYRLFWLEFRRLAAWDPAKHAEFFEALCLPAERAGKILERLASAGFALNG